MGTRGEFKVAITKEDLVFAAAHFITFAGHRCETLHGHNYRAGVVVEGGLEKDTWFVLDFAAVKKLMRRLTDELDHRVLLPRDNPKLTISEEHTSELQSLAYLVCRLLLEKKKTNRQILNT